MPAPEATCLFLNAAVDPALDLLPRGTLCQQHFRSGYDALTRAGYQAVPVLEEEDDRADRDIVLLRAPKQLQELKGLIARGLVRLRPGGLFVVSAANDAGGSRLGELLAEAGLDVSSDSKHKARVCRARTGPALQMARLDAWRQESAMQPVMEGAYRSMPGLFSWDRIDPGSALLADHLPEGLKGDGADFGCGYGFLSRAVLERRGADVRSLACVDADARALAAARENLIGASAETTFHWADLETGSPVRGLDFVVMNPPFHLGKDRNTALGEGCIRAAASALKPFGHLYMVSNRRLPYEALLSRVFSRVETLFEGNGYKLHKAAHPNGDTKKHCVPRALGTQ